MTGPGGRRSCNSPISIVRRQAAGSRTPAWSSNQEEIVSARAIVVAWMVGRDEKHHHHVHALTSVVCAVPHQMFLVE